MSLFLFLLTEMVDTVAEEHYIEGTGYQEWTTYGSPGSTAADQQRQENSCSTSNCGKGHSTVRYFIILYLCYGPHHQRKQYNPF